MSLPCVHCQTRAACQSRGLCSTCYYDPQVRPLYPTASGREPRPSDDFNGPAPLPAPTDALPGTPAKVAVLMWRAKHRQALFHPADPTLPRRGRLRVPGLLVPELPDGG